MMTRQLELRREETRAIHEFVPVLFPSKIGYLMSDRMYCRSCDSLEAQLAQLREMAKQTSDQQPSEQVLSRSIQTPLTISNHELL